MGSLELTRSCHRIYQTLEEKAGEKIVGRLGFRFEGLHLVIVGTSISNRLIKLELASVSRSRCYELKVNDLFAGNPALKDLLNKMSTEAAQHKLTQNGFDRLIRMQLADFFAVNYKSFD